MRSIGQMFSATDEEQVQRDSGMGDRSVNSYLGEQWRGRRSQSLEDYAQEMRADGMGEEKNERHIEEMLMLSAIFKELIDGKIEASSRLDESTLKELRPVFPQTSQFFMNRLAYAPSD